MTLRRSGMSTPLLLCGVVALAGCGAEAGVASKPKPRTLDGATIASRANAQLEQENPHFAHGSLSCPDVRYEVGATSRCMRTVVLDDGRLVRIGATVAIDRVTGTGHYTIRVDNEPTSFGVTGRAVLADLSRQYAKSYGGKRPTGSCPPYLAGKPGTTMTCRLRTRQGRLRVRVEVTRVDPRTYATEYLFKAVK